jgi:hypothetical protein
MINDIDNVLDTAFCKTQLANGHLHRWKSWTPTTPFAPVFDVPIWIDDINKKFIDQLLQIVKENDLGMYKDLWESYNIFKWEYPVLKALRASILYSYNNYMDALELPKENGDSLWIRGWAVSLKPGQGVDRHCHSYHENTYLSGNLMLSDNQTTTDYLIPHLSPYYGPWRCKNIPGRMTIFPSWVEHSVSSVSEQRYSIGYDLFDFHTMEYVSKNKIAGDKYQEIIMQAIPLA